MSLDAPKDWSTTATLNTSLGALSTLGSAAASTIDNLIRELMAQVAAQFGKINFKGANIASAATVDLSLATGNFVDITGTTTITALGTVAAGQVFFLRFNGALTFTYNATSLILPGGASITTASGDIAAMLSLGSGNWVCAVYQRASGGSTFLTTVDNTLPRFDGTGGKLQTSGVVVDDSNNMSGVVGFTTTGVATFGNAFMTVTTTQATMTDGTVSWRAGLGSAGEWYIGTLSNHPWNIQVNTTVIGRFTTAGFAVTGTFSASAAVTLSPANAAVTLSPTGTGVVTINPATAGTINNVSLGATTAASVRATTIAYTTSLTLLAGTAPTAEGSIQWNSTTDRILVGDGAATCTFGQTTSWVSYTPTFTGFGTAASVSIWSRRVADTLQIRGHFTTGTTTATEARMTLGFNGVDGGLTSDTTKVNALQLAGTLACGNTAGAVSYYVLIESNKAYVVFGEQRVGADPTGKQPGTTFGTGQKIMVMIDVPITGW